MNTIKQTILSLYKKFRNFILYGIIGSFSAGMDFLAFYTLTKMLNVHYMYANILSVSVGISISFILNKTFNFKVKDRVFKRFLIFISVGFGGLLLSSALLYFAVNVLKLTPIISKLVSIAFVVLIQFFINKFITFKKELI